ncbi:MAG: hypothetical protein GC162_03670 [Planctomycetes bacterium]|nr:hypothetical protein [Planctomycetota bacterium]
MTVDRLWGPTNWQNSARHGEARQVISRRYAMARLTMGMLAPTLLIARPVWADPAEQSFECDVPGNGWLRVVYALNEVSDYHQFNLSVWARYRAYGEDAERSILNLGPFNRATRDATRPTKIAPTHLRIALAGVGFQYRVQIQFKPENGNNYTGIGEQSGTF